MAKKVAENNAKSKQLLRRMMLWSLAASILATRAIIGAIYHDRWYNIAFAAFVAVLAFVKFYNLAGQRAALKRGRHV